MIYGQTCGNDHLSAAERREVEALARRRKTAQGLARRARIVLAAADGLENKAIVEKLGVDANTVGKWRRRFAEQRLDGLYDEPRPGAPRRIGDDEVAAVICRTLEETPPDAMHWSLRTMASAVGHAPSTIHRIWRAFGLQPHRTETFKLSKDGAADARTSRPPATAGHASAVSWEPSAPRAAKSVPQAWRYQPTRIPEQGCDFSIAIAAILARQLDYVGRQPLLVLAAPRHLALYGAMLAERRRDRLATQLVVVVVSRVVKRHDLNKLNSSTERAGAPL